MKRGLHQFAIMVVFIAIHDQDALSQQVGHRVGIAPQDLVAFGDEHFAIRFGPKDDIRLEHRHGNLKEAPDVLGHDLERPEW